MEALLRQAPIPAHCRAMRALKCDCQLVRADIFGTQTLQLGDVSRLSVQSLLVSCQTGLDLVAVVPGQLAPLISIDESSFSKLATAENAILFTVVVRTRLMISRTTVNLGK